MPDLQPAQFVVGTSAWGSRQSIPNALRVGKSLVAAGFTRFDTAPTYGSGYAHHVLARLNAAAGAPLTIDTKYGQLNELSPRGLAKKLLRAPSPAGFLRSLWQQPTADRHDPAFWTDDRFLAAHGQSRAELPDADIDVFYYHAPPVGVLGASTGAVRDVLAERGTRLGLAEPCADDLVWLDAHPEEELVLQIRFTEFLRHYERLKKLKKAEIRINGLFRDQAEIRDRMGYPAARLGEILEEAFAERPDRKFILGINSQRSADALAGLASGPVSGLVRI